MTRDADDRTAETPAGPPARRSFFRQGLAAILAGLVAAGPVAAVLGFLFDPLLRRRGAGASADGSAPEEPGAEVFVTELSALPADGTPVLYPVAMDLVDAWNREPAQPVGTIFLRRVGDDVEALSAVCPHAGCLVKFAATSREFLCPCHNSSFALDGERIERHGVVNPSPRALDPLAVVLRATGPHGATRALASGEAAPPGDRVEVHVRFVTYRTGTEERIVKS